MYYEDLDNGDRVEAYCNLVHCYALPEDNDLWVEHGYFDDRYCLSYMLLHLVPMHGFCVEPDISVNSREDLQSLARGRALLETTQIDDHELVARPGLWHSRAQVIQGKFKVLSSKRSFQQLQSTHCQSAEDIYWSDKTWQASSGQLLVDDSAFQHNRKSHSLSSKFILA